MPHRKNREDEACYGNAFPSHTNLKFIVHEIIYLTIIFLPPTI